MLLSLWGLPDVVQRALGSAATATSLVAMLLDALFSSGTQAASSLRGGGGLVPLHQATVNEIVGKLTNFFNNFSAQALHV